jgi:hypothetical protein
VLLGNGDGTFQAAMYDGVGGLPVAVVVADVNGDGRLDRLPSFQSKRLGMRPLVCLGRIRFFPRSVRSSNGRNRAKPTAGSDYLAKFAR